MKIATILYLLFSVAAACKPAGSEVDVPAQRPTPKPQVGGTTTDGRTTAARPTGERPTTGAAGPATTAATPAAELTGPLALRSVDFYVADQRVDALPRSLSRSARVDARVCMDELPDHVTVETAWLLVDPSSGNDAGLGYGSSVLPEEDRQNGCWGVFFELPAVSRATTYELVLYARDLKRCAAAKGEDACDPAFLKRAGDLSREFDTSRVFEIELTP